MTAPEDGTCTIEVLSDVTVVARMKDIVVAAGDNAVVWDGLGFDEEVLLSADYTMQATFTSMLGIESQVSKVFTMSKPKQALMYALPASDTLYLGDGSAWALQLQSTLPGKVVMKLYPADDPSKEAGSVVFTAGKDATRVKWNGRVKGKSLAEGRYHVVCWCKTNEAVKREFDLTIAAGKQEVLPVTVTGAVMPSRHATDEEIWQMMTAPAVVFSGAEGSGNPIYDQPKTSGKVLGYVHGASVAVEVIRIEDGGKWAYVGAWELFCQGVFQHSQRTFESLVLMILTVYQIP